VVHAVPLAAARALAEAAAAAESRLRAGTVERKRTSVVLHTRGLDPIAAQVATTACVTLWGAYTGHHGLRLDRIDGGIELRARGRDKGDAVRRLLASTPPQTLPVYLGDDPTDEDAFRAVIGRGVAIRVGSAEQPSAARLRLDSTDEVVTFLGEWAARTTRTRHPARGTP
jgi:trehalose-phosphatase